MIVSKEEILMRLIADGSKQNSQRGLHDLLGAAYEEGFAAGAVHQADEVKRLARKISIMAEKERKDRRHLRG